MGHEGVEPTARTNSGVGSQKSQDATIARETRKRLAHPKVEVQSVA